MITENSIQRLRELLTALKDPVGLFVVFQSIEDKAEIAKALAAMLDTPDLFVTHRRLRALITQPIPPTIATDDEFREVYSQGYRHAMSDLAAVLDTEGDKLNKENKE